MHSQSETICFKIPKTLRLAAVQMPQHDFCRLRPSQWLNDEVVNAYVALLDANTPDNILFVSSFFMSQLHSGGYRKVTRFLKGVSGQPQQGLLTGKASMVIFPISEPVDRRADDPGLHWTLGVLHCWQREAVYYDSFPVSSGFDIFRKHAREYIMGRGGTENVRQEELDAWTYHHAPTPLQNNGCDCGAFLCANMLSVSFGLPHFAQKDIPNIRKHIALQLHRGAIYIPEYNIPKPLPVPVSATQEDINAAQVLLSLGTPTPEPPERERHAVRFDHEVQVQVFRRTVRASGTRDGDSYIENLGGGSDV
ncbi:hypothetical protein PILCRDRAFT_634021 [Piloderma croceum F 1598]|uniref:Ubiquitin-like protease family profile domain-containing protein n=1 Tax=Piloderma croceum (strain F 1598) TaxID=765440 RepID=A0A0C3EWH9_PILCF|nr:hypothetical protein PILCRDRAFT_634021 [Piloderma croceum F 1598]